MILFRWFISIPLILLSTICAWLVAPICPFFAKDYSLKRTWLWWAVTPNTDLRGDPDHQERHNHSNSWWQQVSWVLRNPAVNFQRNTLGIHCQETDILEKGKYLSKVKRNGKTVAWMVFIYKQYPFKKDKALRILLGWKTWDFLVKDPLQITCLVQPWKTFK